MLIYRSLSDVATPTAIALGNFDGVHRGHQAVIDPILRDREAMPPAIPTVVSFDPHPQEFFTGTPRLLLTPWEERQGLLLAMGVRQLVLLPFDTEMARLSPSEFIDRVLRRGLQAERVSVGFNFRFGRDRAGTVEDLQRVWGERLSVAAEQVLPGEEGNPSVRISSSAVRTALAQGEIALATALLGRPYALMGTVGRGQQLGRQLGFPTANLQTPACKLLPRDGVYVVQIEGAAFATPRRAVANIGLRPTVTGATKRTVEVHVPNWSGDLYGQSACVRLLHFLRPEKKFASFDKLKEQIQVDCDAALQFQALSPDTVPH